MSGEQEHPQPKNKESLPNGVGFGFGIALGVVFGAALNAAQKRKDLNNLS